MADDGTHPTRQLSLEDVHMIVGRGILDKAFREAFGKDPEGALKRMGISLYHDGQPDHHARNLVKAIADVFGRSGELNVQDAINAIHEAYQKSSDGVIRPRCG